MTESQLLLSVARGDTPADLVLTGGRVVNVFTGEIENADIAIRGDRIAGVGADYNGHQRMDLAGSFVAPGLIDAHVHIESSLCTPAQFASAVVPRGITSAVIDPHEIANVSGEAGVRYMAAASVGLPLDVTVMAPSCVPATDMASSGGRIDSGVIAALRADGVAHGLAEVMNFPGVVGGAAEMLARLEAMLHRPRDGHCPGVVGKSLNAYVASGVGSDHESVTPEEAREKLARGLYLLIREATNARNLDTLLPVITPANSRRICFCTDDRTPGDLLNVGSIDYMVRRAIDFGIDPIEALRMASLNPSEWFGLHHVGAIAPGRQANLIVFDDLEAPTARLVFSSGRLVARDGQMLQAIAASREPQPTTRCQVDWNAIRFSVRSRGDRVRVIGSMPDQLVTEHRVLPACNREGLAHADPSRDLLKMLVLERHGGHGAFGVGFIQGMGLRIGAIAGTVAHDHHNLVIIGADDTSMQTAGRAVEKMGGGLAIAVGETVLELLPLPVAGLMSNLPVREVAAAYARLIAHARANGSPLADPFMAMSFMALEVIPSLKLTDRGLVDVDQFQIVDLFV